MQLEDESYKNKICELGPPESTALVLLVLKERRALGCVCSWWPRLAVTGHGQNIDSVSKFMP